MADKSMTQNLEHENIITMDEKKLIVGEKLQKREDVRLSHQQKRRDEKSETTSVKENTKYFTENFAKDQQHIEKQLSECDNMEKKQLLDKFDAISVLHQKLQRFVTESTMFLPSYEIRQAQEALSNLSTKISEKRDELLPKKKFAFKSKKKESAVVKDIYGKEETKDEEEIEDIKLADCKFVDLKNEEMEMKDSEINQKDVALARLDSCTIKLYGSPSAIHINKLNNCKVFSGPVSGSVFIRECVNCVFVVPCQQLRTHTTKSSKFYIHVTSRAIIEDCSDVQFGPYNLQYPKIDDHYEISGLDRKRNNWDDIDDFNWLAADTHSPNWSLVPEDEMSPEWEL